MKKIFYSFLFIQFFYLNANAQVPQQIPYQAIVMEDGMPLSNADIDIRVNILDALGAIQFTEDHSTSTDAYGVAQVLIGTNGGDLSAVPWSVGGLSIQLSYDTGSGMEVLGIQEIGSVPYALYALSSNGIVDIMVDQNGDLVVTDAEGNMTTIVGIGGDSNLVFDIDNDGNLVIINPDGSRTVIGNVTGPQGPNGQDGTGVRIIGSVDTESDLDLNYMGEIGDMVIVQSTGDGHVWDGNIWVNVGGIRGPQGSTGPAGPEGPQGIQGNTGPVGADGEMGPQGEQGDQGETGSMGLPGTPGDIGPQGNTGSIGPQGEQGPAGEVGPTGDTGPQGPAGATGTGVLAYANWNSDLGKTFGSDNISFSGNSPVVVTIAGFSMDENNCTPLLTAGNGTVPSYFFTGGQLHVSPAGSFNIAVFR